MVQAVSGENVIKPPYESINSHVQSPREWLPYSLITLFIKVCLKVRFQFCMFVAFVTNVCHIWPIVRFISDHMYVVYHSLPRTTSPTNLKHYYFMIYLKTRSYAEILPFKLNLQHLNISIQ